MVDELTRLVGLLKGIKMESVDPELFAGDTKTFGDWLVDKLIYSASMSQSVGFYVWVATPSSAVGSRGFTKGDIDSLNIYTLATRDNLKFADGGPAAFSAPRTDANHPVFIRGYVAEYCHQNKRWYHVENLSKQVAAKASLPVRLTNYWVPDSMQAQSSSVFTATHGEGLEARSPTSTDNTKDSTNVKRPDFSRVELGLVIAELCEWIEAEKVTKPSEVYEKWKSRKHGFSRPEIRFLLQRIEDL